MGAKLIELVNQKGGTMSLPFDHAKALFVLEARLGKQNWELTKDSNYIFENGDLIQRSGDRVNQESKEPKGAKKGRTKKGKA